MALSSQAARRKDMRVFPLTLELQHRHFAFMAAVLKSEKPGSNWDVNKRLQWQLMVRSFADACSRTNPRFDRERFLAACNYDESERV